MRTYAPDARRTLYHITADLIPVPVAMGQHELDFACCRIEIQTELQRQSTRRSRQNALYPPEIIVSSFMTFCGSINSCGIAQASVPILCLAWLLYCAPQRHADGLNAHP
jgi:hypothetical protein